MNLSSLTPAEHKELDGLVRPIADGIVSALVAEVEDPIVRRLAVREAAQRFGFRVTTFEED